MLAIEHLAGAKVNYGFGTAMIFIAVIFFPGIKTPKWIKLTALTLATATAIQIFP